MIFKKEKKQGTEMEGNRNKARPEYSFKEKE